MWYRRQGRTGDQAQADSICIGRGIAFAELVQETAEFLIGLWRRPNRDNRFKVTTGFTPELITQTKSCCREQQISVVTVAL
jgi:hypothetical protein